MFNDDVLETLLMDEEMRHIPIGCQSTVIHVIENFLDDYVKEKPYATISELLSGYVPTE